MSRLAISIVFLFSFKPICYANHSYTFGVVPQQSPGQLVRSWVPIIKYLERETGVKLRFATRRTIPAFEEACASEDFDFVYMNPLHYIEFHDNAGYTSFAKARNKKIKGIIIVRKDSEIKILKDLTDKRLAFPSSDAFAASIIPRVELKRRNINFHIKYLGSHDQIYHSVADGIWLAGGGVMRTLMASMPRVRKNLEYYG